MMWRPEKPKKPLRCRVGAHEWVYYGEPLTDTFTLKDHYPHRRCFLCEKYQKFYGVMEQDGSVTGSYQ